MNKIVDLLQLTNERRNTSLALAKQLREDSHVDLSIHFQNLIKVFGDGAIDYIARMMRP